jgi:hypothetical protein
MGDNFKPRRRALSLRERARVRAGKGETMPSNRWA